MLIREIQLCGIRSFHDTRTIYLGARCNVFVGHNNAGKSTILRSVLAFQGFNFSHEDIRIGSDRSYHTAVVSDWLPSDYIDQRTINHPARYVRVLRGNAPDFNDIETIQKNSNPLFDPRRPRNSIVPFVAKRKASGFNQNVNLDTQSSIDGTFSNLYSRIDLLATAGHPCHQRFIDAVNDIVGLTITTKSSQNGKEAGFYFDEDHFVTLDRMGDGVSEMVGLIVELCLERRKIFVLEEPETNLHPRGIKGLMKLIQSSSEHNQFLIATHSNIVVRELGIGDENKIFRVFREESDAKSPSTVEVVSTAAEHVDLLRELGYEFADLQLHEAWLFLEEASAETVIRDILIPWFAPELLGRLRTFSAAGVGNLEPSVAEFQRLVVFVHLQPAYVGRLWVRADGDPPGQAAIAALRAKFDYLTAETAATFAQDRFESYFPERFQEEVTAAFAIAAKKDRRAAKEVLLRKVVEWSLQNETEARADWETCAAEPIQLLREIASRLA